MQKRTGFGSCANPLFSWPQLRTGVCVTGEVDAETGYVYDLGKLQQIIEEEVEARLDHKT